MSSGFEDAAHEDVVIAVMGATGAGKSSFIKLVSGRDDVKVGESLHSETCEVCAYEFFHNGTNYILVDTPGFDDTDRPDSEITSAILTWMRESLIAGQALNGVIYLHRLTNPRMGGTALRNNRMFRKLVGQHAFKNVVLATTFWEQVPEALAAKREEELCDNRDFWGTMVEKGAGMVRLEKEHDRIAALGLIERISSKGKIVLQAQDEIVNQGKAVSDTEAAREVREETERLERELSAARKAERRRMGRELEAEREQRARALKEEQIEMDRNLATWLELEQWDQLDKEDAESRSHWQQVKELEDERKRREEQRRYEVEGMEKMLQEEIAQEAQHKMELLTAFQSSYVCVGHAAGRWPCDKCKKAISANSTCYHCCFCDSDRYFHCVTCGDDCGEPSHPVMRSCQTPRSDDGCVLI